MQKLDLVFYVLSDLPQLPKMQFTKFLTLLEEVSNRQDPGASLSYTDAADTELPGEQPDAE